ncbi:hypothetical protein [Hymenobacter sp. GOD-10R]|uniref:hypothetical protein n=1 Tax=Hymenobacter sp. GOD-10R TaxID=3093922 RepID=UPI002D793841|nr:hypothetical protein [Hymenobacter sp. GOD-10R]WRQ31600.1 hypothetical protein SD425_27600 [Hymenobacter sp. GOD-10R]
MKKSVKMNMVGNMAKVEPLPAQTADELIYDLPASNTAVTPVTLSSGTPMLPAPIIKIPFTNQLTPETFLRLKQFECWGGMEIQDILEEALTAFFADKPEADRELPIKAKEKLRKKLPNLK